MSKLEKDEGIAVSHRDLVSVLPVCADETPWDYSLLNLLMHNSISLLAEG